MLLGKLWDKIDAGMRKNILASTCFLSPRELELSRYLFGTPEGLQEFGGYEDAERKMLVYLPEYLDASALTEEDSPLVCLRATFYQGDSPSHRDFLGALIGAGISRENIGDICVGKGSCDFFVTAGKAAIDGLPCEKPDKMVSEGAKISVRGLGKIKLAKINGTTKKDRISVVIHQYV